MWKKTARTTEQNALISQLHVQKDIGMMRICSRSPQQTPVECQSAHGTTWTHESQQYLGQIYRDNPDGKLDWWASFRHGHQDRSSYLNLPFLLSHKLKQPSEDSIYRPGAYGLVVIAWIGYVSIKIDGFFTPHERAQHGAKVEKKGQKQTWWWWASGKP